MFANFKKNIFQYYKWFITSAASALTLFSTAIHAKDTVNPDIELWLKKPTSEANTHSDHTYYFTSDDGVYLNDTSRDITFIDQRINQDSFKKSTKKIHKANEKKLLSKLNEKFKVPLFRYKGRRNKNNIYVNLTKREIVSKNNFYGLKYEIRLSEKIAKIRLRYRF